MTSRTGTPGAGLEVRLLGPVEVRHDGAAVPLPRSKKTRALLAYLIATGRAHSREQLCSLLWDDTYDPRGALRWSLSKLRGALDGVAADRIVADRQQVSFDLVGLQVDHLELEAAATRRLAELEVDELERLAGLARGEFLEDCELPDLFAFQAWCIAGRESARELRCRVLAELVHRLRDDTERALPHARARARADSLSPVAHRDLLVLLVAAGKRDEAEQQYELARRYLRDARIPDASDIDRAWRALTARPATPATPASAPPSAPPAAPVAGPFVGREHERSRLETLLAAARERGGARVAVVLGEPGAGKSALAARFVQDAAGRGAAVLAGRAYEAERSRPFGPWVEALGSEVSVLSGSAGEDAGPASREELFAEVADAVARRTGAGEGVVLLLDDVQWLDRDSVELLHVVVRSDARVPLLVLLLARTGELSDNEPAQRALRSIHREVPVETIELAPLGAGDIGTLVSGFPGVDAERVHRASAGNPLYALELARAVATAADPGDAPLSRLVQDRVDRLPPRAAELLRWAAVLGQVVDVARLEAVSGLDPRDLVDLLEQLEQRALLRSSADGCYRFAHDVVREAVYGELSHPRRRLMHREVARWLAPRTDDPTVATELARHASLAGDAELAVRACVEAGARSLRVFANADAEALALRGLELVGELDEVDRIAATLDLLHIQYSARTPDRDEAADRIQALASQALDLGLTRAARLGFQMLSFLRWESSSMADAHENILQAERVSRNAGADERAAALGQAARCLVLLERNLGQAEAFVLEADALASRAGIPLSSVRFATAMIHEHRGELDEAVAAFREARWAGREQGDRLAEFRAIEHWTMLEIDRGRIDEARALATELTTLGARVREGAEAPSSRALQALVHRHTGEDGAATDQLEQALADLVLVDAKYPLAFVLIRLGRLELERGDVAAAVRHAGQGLEFAAAVGRVSDVAMARALLARGAALTGDDGTVGSHLDALTAMRGLDLSAAAREALESALAPPETVG